MNWIIASLLMLVFSNVYYLILRRAQQKGIPGKLYMVANFSVPPLLYYLLGSSKGLSFVLPLAQLTMVFLISLFLNWFSALVSYYAITKAPNAGYSLIIQKSYAIYTGIAAIFLFGSVLPWQKFAAIIIVLASTTLVIAGEKVRHKDTGLTWVGLSFVTFFLFGTLRLAGRWMVFQGVPVVVYLFYLHGIVAIISLFDLGIHWQMSRIKMTTERAVLLLGIGISVTLFYYFFQVAEVASPNIGYVNAINTASNALYTILVAWLLGDSLSGKKFLGVLGVTFGIILLLV